MRFVTTQKGLYRNIYLKDNQIVMDFPNSHFDVIQVKQKFEPLFKMFENLRTISLLICSMNKTFCQWISALFPEIKSIKIYINVINIETKGYDGQSHKVMLWSKDILFAYR